MTLQEAINAANNGDVSAMEALLNYYEQDESTDSILKWFDWGRKAVQAGSVVAAKKTMVAAYKMGDSLKKENNYDFAKMGYNDASQAGIRLIGDKDYSLLAKAITDHALYNMALIIFENSDEEEDWNRAYTLVSMADSTELKPYLLEAYINHPCNLDATKLEELIERLMTLRKEAFIRNDIDADSIFKQIYSFDNLDIKMVATLYYKTAMALCENYRKFDMAKRLLEYGGKVIPIKEMGDALVELYDNLVQQYAI